jgi:hypothetical protein
MKIDIEIVNIVDTYPEIVWWNSWDGEHLVYIHKSYSNPSIKYLNKNISIFEDSIKIPYIGIRIRSLVTIIQTDGNCQLSFAKNWLFNGYNKISTEFINGKTHVTVIYTIETFFVISFLFTNFIRKSLIEWNKKIWIEDLPLKRRRDKALKYGFEDFKGLPYHLNDRFDKRPTYVANKPPFTPKNKI